MTLIRGARTGRLPGRAAAAFLAVLLPAGLAVASTALASTALASTGSGGAAARPAASPAACPWLNQSLPVGQRVQMVLAR